MEIKFQMSEQEFKDLQTICKITNTDTEKFIYEAVHRDMLPYYSYSEKGETELHIRKGIFLNTDISGETVNEEPCVILGETSMFGNPYYKIVKKGQLFKVPAGLIKDIAK